MRKKNPFETPREVAYRKRSSAIVKYYLDNAHYITSGEAKVYNVIERIAKKYSMSPMGVMKLLRREGVYKNCSEPVIYPEGNNSAVNL